MRWSDTMRRQVHLNTQAVPSSEALHALVAQQCRAFRDSLIESGEAPERFRIVVDRQADLAEEQVRLDGGHVLYVFSGLAEAVVWCLGALRDRSPARSGNFRNSWFMMVDGRIWTGTPQEIPPGSEVWIANTAPYARKIEVGGQRTGRAPRIVESVRVAAHRRFRTVRAERDFKALWQGRDARGGPVPYILRGAGIASGLSWSRKGGWSRTHAAYVSRRADRQAGSQVLYPTLVLTEKV
ncbi:hypothetical protein [Swaminathania salitolerans]|uniref:Uncharacterized protein n=1 Tax=Swaminathania salitolerans TaxID=182838 RepID=A0A511BV63_9PROT|nr:hypothetical protein [Swaminathania salitolerans]GEL01868.1 hypothetical protein SSA02_10310 [Swaminathania salitolerans]